MARAVGVANIRAFDGRLAAESACVSRRPAGPEFAELAAVVLAARRQ